MDGDEWRRTFTQQDIADIAATLGATMDSNAEAQGSTIFRLIIGEKAKLQLHVGSDGEQFQC